MYLNLGSLLFYPMSCFLVHFIYLEIARADKHIFAAHSTELSLFDIEPAGLAIAMPSMIPVIVYFVTRIKFWFVDEGDRHPYDFYNVTLGLDKEYKRRKQSLFN